jgi:DNA-binding winged helix-turn-helix (wHTH) protein
MIYTFEDLEIDEDLFEVRRGGARVEVQPKVMNLLIFLAYNHHRVVPRAEIMASVWPGVAVTDDSLSQAIRGARRSLGRAAEAIRTVRGRGYRLVPSSLEAPAASPSP